MNALYPPRAVRFVCLLAAILAAGCTAPVREDEIELPEYVSPVSYPVTVSVDVFGDATGSAMSRPFPLSGSDLRSALIDSINNSKLVTSAAESGGDIKLTVGLMQLVQPVWSGEIVSKQRGFWTLTTERSRSQIDHDQAAFINGWPARYLRDSRADEPSGGH